MDLYDYLQIGYCQKSSLKYHLKKRFLKKTLFFKYIHIEKMIKNFINKISKNPLSSYWFYKYYHILYWYIYYYRCFSKKHQCLQFLCLSGNIWIVFISKDHFNHTIINFNVMRFSYGYIISKSMC